MIALIQKIAVLVALSVIVGVAFGWYIRGLSKHFKPMRNPFREDSAFRTILRSFRKSGKSKDEGPASSAVDWEEIELRPVDLSDSKNVEPVTEIELDFLEGLQKRVESSGAKDTSLRPALRPLDENQKVSLSLSGIQDAVFQDDGGEKTPTDQFGNENTARTQENYKLMQHSLLTLANELKLTRDSLNQSKNNPEQTEAVSAEISRIEEKVAFMEDFLGEQKAQSQPSSTPKPTSFKTGRFSEDG